MEGNTGSANSNMTVCSSLCMCCFVLDLQKSVIMRHCELYSRHFEVFLGSLLLNSMYLTLVFPFMYWCVLALVAYYMCIQLSN